MYDQTERARAHEHINQVEELMSQKNALKAVADKLRTMILMVRDSLNGKYKISAWSFLAIMSGIFYVVNTMDAVPDFIPVAGLVDDATVITWIAQAIAHDMRRYNEWAAGKEKI